MYLHYETDSEQLHSARTHSREVEVHIPLIGYTRKKEKMIATGLDTIQIYPRNHKRNSPQRRQTLPKQ